MKNQQPKGPVATEPIKTPRGTIRRGDRKPYRKAPNAEIELRVIEIAELLRTGLSRYKIHDLVCQKWDLTWDVIDRMYIPRARKYLRERAGISADDAKEKCLDKLFEILERGNNKEAIAAETRLAQIYGYNAPTKIAHTDPTGEQEFTGVLREVSINRLRELANQTAPEAPLSNGHQNGHTTKR